MGRRCTVEVFLLGTWRPAAQIELRRAEERLAPTWLEYDPDYATEQLDARDHRAVSVRYPVDFTLHDLTSFPGFAIDLMPQGEARRVLAAHLADRQLATSDFNILCAGARNPVGNLRVREAVTAPPEPGPGLTHQDVVERGDALSEWAAARGVPMTGASDTAGASPKLLLTEDEGGLLHADGALPDPRARQHFIVKFPRGRTRRDAQVLANEAPYLEVLRKLGLKCGATLEHHSGALFVPRFDRRPAHGGVERNGVESLDSVMGVVQAGARLEAEAACNAIAAVVDCPVDDVIEFVLRDAAALALGNPDNHGRNTSLLKQPNGCVRLSPVYDFAPMFLDPDGVARTTKWRSEKHGRVDWSEVAESLANLIPLDLLQSRLREFGTRLRKCPEFMAHAGVDRELIERRQSSIAEVASALEQVGRN